MTVPKCRLESEQPVVRQRGDRRNTSSSPHGTADEHIEHGGSKGSGAGQTETYIVKPNLAAAAGRFDARLTLRGLIQDLCRGDEVNQRVALVRGALNGASNGALIEENILLAWLRVVAKGENGIRLGGPGAENGKENQDQKSGRFMAGRG